MTRPTTMKGVLTTYTDNAGEWRWRCTLRLFGKDITVAASTEGYKKRIDCVKNAELVLMNKWEIDE